MDDLFKIECPACGSHNLATLESVGGTCGVLGFFIEDGELKHEDDGNGTEVSWDSAETDRATPYVCRSCGAQHTAAALIAKLDPEKRAQITAPTPLAPVTEATHAAQIAPELPSESALIAELQAYCAANDLPLMSADELASLDGIRDENRTWLRAYVVRWDDMEESRRQLHDACNAVATAEGWGLFNEDTSIQRDDEADRFASDDDALGYVRRMAAAGSPVHAYALERLAAGTGLAPMTRKPMALRDALDYVVSATYGASRAIEHAAEACTYPDNDAMTMLLKRAANDARALEMSVHALPTLLARHYGAGKV